MKLSKLINGLIMVLAILVTAGITSWVMMKKNPGLQWNSTFYYPQQQVASTFSPGIAAANICTECHPVVSTIPNVTATTTLPHDHRAICSNCHYLASVRGPIPAAVVGQTAGGTGVPVIRAGAVPLHAERGVCTNCHEVINNLGNPIPDISVLSTSPHENRGVCANCHRLTKQSGFNANTGGTQAAIPMAAAGLVAAPRTTAPLNPATEGEWMGLEVAPITPLTAGQYGIPNGICGLVVAEAEGQAAVADLKAGDVVLSVNGAPTSNMTEFFQATRNGTLTNGIVEVFRKGQELKVDIAQKAAPVPAAVPNTPANNRAGMPAAMPTPQGGTPIYPGNPAGGAGSGPGNAQGWGPGTACPK